MYTSKQFSELTELPIDTLRYYERIGLITPSRDKNNYRCYSEADFTWIDFIKKLKRTGMPIKDILVYSDFRSTGVSTISERKKMLIQHYEAMQKEIQETIQTLMYIEEKITLYTEMEKDMFD